VAPLLINEILKEHRKMEESSSLQQRLTLRLQPPQVFSGETEFSRKYIAWDR